MNQWFGPPGFWSRPSEPSPALERGAASLDGLYQAQSTEDWPLCDEYVDRYLREYGLKHKTSSLQTQTRRLRRFREDFRGRSLNLSRAELKDWIRGEGGWSHRKPIPPSNVPAVVSLFNHAIDEDDLPLGRSPARKLAPPKRPGRADIPPPSRSEFEALVDACSALMSNAKMMRALLLFAAYSLMRPGELFALKWSDLDFATNRIRTLRRDYRGDLDVPKSGIRIIAMTPPAREAIRSLPRDSDLVFTLEDGAPMTSKKLSEYWRRVQTAAGLQFDFYHATKHYGVHYMWAELNLPLRAIAAQAGWKLTTAVEMLAIYGHPEIGVLDEVDSAFQPHKEFLASDTEGVDRTIPLRGEGAIVDVEEIEDIVHYHDEFLGQDVSLGEDWAL